MNPNGNFYANPYGNLYKHPCNNPRSNQYNNPCNNLYDDSCCSFYNNFFANSHENLYYCSFLNTGLQHPPLTCPHASPSAICPAPAPNQAPAGFPAMLHEQRQGYSYIRFLNAAPGLLRADVYINGGQVAAGLSYKGFTEYMRMLPGKYNIKIFPDGNKSRALLDTRLEIPARAILTGVVAGLPPDIGIKTFFETVVRIPRGKIRLRFSNLVLGSPDVDLALSGGQILFEGISFEKATNYIEFDAGIYAFYLRQSNTAGNMLYIPGIRLAEGGFYTIYALGEAKGGAPLQVVISLDGNSYINVG